MHSNLNHEKHSVSLFEALKIMMLSFFGDNFKNSSFVNYRLLKERFIKHLDIENIILIEKENSILKKIFLEKQ